MYSGVREMDRDVMTSWAERGGVQCMRHREMRKGKG